MCEYKELLPDPVSPSSSGDSSAAGNTPNCPICQETTKDSYLVRRFNCGHLAHQNCLKSVTQRCPVCRADLTGEMMLCRNKKALVNLYRHSIAFDKEGFNIQVAVDVEGLEARDAFKQLKSLHEDFTSTVLDMLVKQI
jgi:hypothetical protein